MKWSQLEVEVQEHTSPPATVYRVSGVITDTHEAFELLDLVRKGLKKGAPLHVFDLSDVPHVTSAGVGIIAAAFTTAQGLKKRFVLASSSSRIESILKVIGLWSMIEHFESVDAALKS